VSEVTSGIQPYPWESHAEALANADGPTAIKAVLETLLAGGAALDLHPAPPAGVAAQPPAPHVFLARDTRPTGPGLAAAATAGTQAIAGDAAVTDFGLMTTVGSCEQVMNPVDL
jgi:phosphomannomutase